MIERRVHHHNIGYRARVCADLFLEVPPVREIIERAVLRVQIRERRRQIYVQTTLLLRAWVRVRPNDVNVDKRDVRDVCARCLAESAHTECSEVIRLNLDPLDQNRLSRRQAGCLKLNHADSRVPRASQRLGEDRSSGSSTSPNEIDPLVENDVLSVRPCSKNNRIALARSVDSRLNVPAKRDRNRSRPTKCSNPCNHPCNESHHSPQAYLHSAFASLPPT